MAKPKAKSRSKTHAGGQSPSGEMQRQVEPQRPNRVLLAISGALVALWFVYLVFVALNNW